MTLHIAWIEKVKDEQEPEKAAEVTIWDPIEFRIAIFEEPIIRFPNGGTGEILDRATELLEKDGFKVHTTEPTGNGWAAIVESAPE